MKNAKFTTLKPRRHLKLIAILCTTVLSMFGFAFALVPLYDKFCEITGILGKIDGERVRIEGVMTADNSRTITVEFITRVNDNMPWEFYSEEKSIVIHPGEMNYVVFYAANKSDKDMVGQAIPSVAPGEMNRYFKKTQCFCFDRTELDANSSMEMPVVFFVDKDIPADVPRITLSYTMFEAV